MYIFVEQLSFRAVFSIYLFLREKGHTLNSVHVRYILNDGYLSLLWQYLPKLNLGSVKLFDFSFDSLVDENGTNLGKKVVLEDLETFYRLLGEKIILPDYLGLNPDKHMFKAYLKKNITLSDFSSTGVKSLINILIMIKAVSFYKTKFKYVEPVFLMLEKKQWINELCEYGAQKGIGIIENKFIELNLYYNIKRAFKKNNLILRLRSFINIYLNRGDSTNISSCIVIDQVLQILRPKWIWKSEFLAPKEITFVSKSHSINQKVLNEIKSEGMNLIVLNRTLCRGLKVPIFLPSYSSHAIKSKSDESSIINLYANQYFNEKKHWRALFKRIKAKVYITSHKWDAHPLAAAAAMSEVGGISGVFQTSYYELPVPYALTCADLYFSFSRKAPMIELKQGSRISYNICLGNLANSRNKFFKVEAKKLRGKLKNNGATKIISYFDQDSFEDKRWGTSHSVSRESYKYLLKKVIEEKWLGLIIKPKKPKKIRRNLGDVSVLLDQALETGRCHIIDNYDEFSPKNFENPPALCAMASDISIQESMIEGTAAVEAVLTGTQTLMMDRYGFKESQFYKLGVGKVIFNEWASLWKNLEEHWRKAPISGFGDWSPIMDDIEPFRDEKASERLTKFLYWLSEGFKEGQNKKENLEHAVKLYSFEWGEDKVFQYNNLEL